MLPTNTPTLYNELVNVRELVRWDRCCRLRLRSSWFGAGSISSFPVSSPTSCFKPSNQHVSLWSFRYFSTEIYFDAYWTGNATSVIC